MKVPNDDVRQVQSSKLPAAGQEDQRKKRMRVSMVTNGRGLSWQELCSASAQGLIMVPPSEPKNCAKIIIFENTKTKTPDSVKGEEHASVACARGAAKHTSS